jgi:hypothetical protein
LVVLSRTAHAEQQVQIQKYPLRAESKSSELKEEEEEEENCKYSLYYGTFVLQSTS